MSQNGEQRAREINPKPTITIVALVVIVPVLFAVIMAQSKRSTTSHVEIRRQKIEAAFSPWDGSHRGLVAYIKKAMNDPGSFEHVKTVYRDMQDHLIVTSKFRGRNAFGGIVTNYVEAKVDLSGRVIAIIDWTP